MHTRTHTEQTDNCSCQTRLTTQLLFASTKHRSPAWRLPAVTDHNSLRGHPLCSVLLSQPWLLSISTGSSCGKAGAASTDHYHWATHDGRHSYASLALRIPPPLLGDLYRCPGSKQLEAQKYQIAAAHCQRCSVRRRNLVPFRALSGWVEATLLRLYMKQKRTPVVMASSTRLSQSCERHILVSTTKSTSTKDASTSCLCFTSLALYHDPIESGGRCGVFRLIMMLFAVYQGLLSAAASFAEFQTMPCSLVQFCAPSSRFHVIERQSGRIKCDLVQYGMLWQSQTRQRTSFRVPPFRLRLHLSRNSKLQSAPTKYSSLKTLLLKFSSWRLQRRDTWMSGVDISTRSWG
jgi:hypothetical protein